MTAHRPALATAPVRPAAAYLRLSEAREDSVSIASQRELVKAAANTRGWGVPVLFVDEGVSGSKDVKRPVRDDLERRIGAGEFSALIVKSVDRLARSVVDFARIAKACRDADCALVVTDLGLDASTPAGEMVVSVLATLAQFEARQISARVAASNDYRRRIGRVIGGPVPYGLRNVKVDGVAGTHREVDPAEAGVVRRIAESVLRGASLRSVAASLNADGVAPPRGKADSLWDQSAVRRVLTNPALIGQTRHGRDVLRGEDGMPRTDARCMVLDRETFDAVQDAIKDRGSAVPSRTPSEAPLLLDGIALCASCGRRLARQSTHGGRYLNYSCTGAARTRCAAPTSAAASALDALVVAAFLEAVGDVPMTRVSSRVDPQASARLRDVRSEVAATMTRLTDADADTDDVEALSARLVALKRAEAAARTAVASGPLSVMEDLGYTYGERWAELADDVPARRQMLAAWVGPVVVHRAGSGSGRHDLAARTSITVRS